MLESLEQSFSRQTDEIRLRIARLRAAVETTNNKMEVLQRVISEMYMIESACKQKYEEIPEGKSFCLFVDSYYL